MTNTEAQTQHFIILQKIKELGFVEGKTLTEIADNLGTTRQNIGSIKTKIEAHQDCIEGNFKSHYKKINLKKYKDYYVFILSGTGSGLIAKITSNNATTLNFAALSISLDTTSVYQIVDFPYE